MGKRCKSFEDMFNTALIAPPRRKKAKAKPKPMFPSPEAKAAFLAKEKADTAIWLAASADDRRDYKIYHDDCRDARVGMRNIMEFEDWRTS
tara:strand:- start:51 stop:323 length:273 start_codon:yes stop_codon:yes gene_type:complete